MTASTVLRGGKVLGLGGWMPGTPTDAVLRSAPRAVAIEDGVVVAVGPEADSLVGAETEVIELDGRTVIPGIADPHLHLSALSLRAASYISLADMAGWDELGHRLSSAGSEHEWVLGAGWNDLRIGRGYSRDDLDQCAADIGLEDRPILLFDWSGHTALANSRAIEAAGLAMGGAASDGYLDGDRLAAVTRAMPHPSSAQRRRALLTTQDTLHRLGITAVTDPGLGPAAPSLLDGTGTEEALAALEQLAGGGLLTLRVSVLLLLTGPSGGSAGELEALLDSSILERFGACDPDRLRIAGVKIFADGVPMNGTSWMSKPYLPGGGRGSLAVTGDRDRDKVRELQDMIAVVHRRGLQIGVHAVGDASVDAAVRAIAIAAQQTPQAQHRHYVIHAPVISDDALEQLVDHRIGLVLNPVITRQGRGMSGHAPDLRQMEPIRTLQSRGVAVAIGSDAPVASADWRENVIHAVTRSQLYEERPAGDREGVSGVDALALMTVAPAYQEGAERWRGALTPGMRADLTVLDGEWPSDERITDLRERPSALTMVNGKTVWKA